MIAPDGSAPDEKVSILLVDDRPENLTALRAILDRPDYDLICAESGEAALKQVLQHDLAVILLDVAMPEMDGFAVAATVRQRQRFRFIPIIFVTASVQDTSWIFKAYSVGAIDLLQKPLDADQVRAKVQVFVALHRQRRQIEQQAERLRASAERERALELATVRAQGERRFRNLTEAIPHVVWTADAQGEVRSLNVRWQQITGMDSADALVDGWMRAIHRDDRERIRALWAQAIAAGRPFEIECRLHQLDGAYRWYLCRGLPEPDESGRASSWLGTFTDVNEQRRTRDEARAAVALRDEFLSVASHELRTPLTALLLHLQNIERHLARLDGPAEPLQPKVLSAIRQTNRLAELINRLLDLSQLATGRFSLRPEPLDLAEILREVVERFRDVAARAGCTLNAEIRGGLKGKWDRLRIEQVVTNLLANAIKYAPGHPVELVGEGADDGVVVRVRDHGMGIGPEDLTRIFGRFERAVSSRNYGGLGLGLYIAREIVIRQGGKLTVKSEPGHGAEFVVSLPRQPSLEPPAALEPALPQATDWAPGAALVPPRVGENGA